MEKTISEYDSIIKNCNDIFAKKMKDYGSAWRILRISSLTDQIFIKAQRIRSIEQKGIQKIDLKGRLQEIKNGKLKNIAGNNRLIIDGSSYKGEANLDCAIGNWWNHKILEANQQISPLSGSLKDQVVKFIGYENIILYGKNFSAAHYKLKSKDDNLPKDKKLDFDIWVDKKSNLIIKIAYKRMGDWEYRLKSFQ